MPSANKPSQAVKNTGSCLPSRFTTIQELKEAMRSLPLLRAPREGCDPRQTVVALHAEDLDEAQAYYRQQGDVLPEFYVLGAERQQELAQRAAPNRHAFTELQPGMDVQLYFRQGSAPRLTAYPRLAAAMQQQGITSYFLERHCTEKFYSRNSKCLYSDADWEVILHFFHKMQDDDSRHTYLAVCRARLDAEPGYIPVADYKQYFHPQVCAEAGDIVCEGGCYAKCADGKIISSSTLNFYNALKGKGKIIGFEPVEAMCRELQAAFAPYDDIQMEHKALWSHTGQLRLCGSGGACFTVEGPTSAANCVCTSIDDYFSDTLMPSLIKLDVEGAEPEVLTGAHRTLKNGLPKLMISIYHGRRGSDWITVPKILLEQDLPYEYYCGHHRPWYNETIVYARSTTEK